MGYHLGENRIPRLLRPGFGQTRVDWSDEQRGLEADDVVIEHLGLDRCLDHLRTHQLESPGKQLIENCAEALAGRPRKRFEELFHRMRRSQLVAGRLDDRRIPRVRLEMIEIPQVPTRAVEQETKELLEEGPEGNPLRLLRRDPNASSKSGAS